MTLKVGDEKKRSFRKISGDSSPAEGRRWFARFAHEMLGSLITYTLSMEVPKRHLMIRRSIHGDFDAVGDESASRTNSMPVSSVSRSSSWSHDLRVV